MKLMLLSFASLFAVSALIGDGPAARVPVLVELFTSEGCSSCPPADALLQKLDREQPVAGADVIVLSEHVDYWNSLGWADPFSSVLYSQRQRDYAQALSGEVYTPEMVVDGANGFVGSNEGNARRAVQDAAKGGKSLIRVQAERQDKKAKVSIHIDQPVDGVLYLALAHEVMKSQVLRGENSGRGLSHVAVVYSLQKIGKVERSGAGYDQDVTVDVKPGSRIVAFVEKSGVGKVTALGQTRL